MDQNFGIDPPRRPPRNFGAKTSQSYLAAQRFFRGDNYQAVPPNNGGTMDEFYRTVPPPGPQSNFRKSQNNFSQNFNPKQRVANTANRGDRGSTMATSSHVRPRIEHCIPPYKKSTRISSVADSPRCVSYPAQFTQINKRNPACELKGPRLLGYRDLEKLLEKTVNEIIPVIMNSQNGFEKLLQSKPKPDITYMIVVLLGKICESDFIESLLEILTKSLTNDFLDHIKNHVTDFLTEKNQIKLKRSPDFFKSLICFFNKATELLPLSTVHCFGKKLGNLLLLIDLVMKNICLLNSEITYEEDLFKNLNEIKQRIELLTIQKDNSKGLEKYSDPPNDFMSISLFPTPEDFQKRNFLRPNLLSGTYKDLNEYLDVQFRLLREDFIEPLRNGIKEYLSSKNGYEKIKRRNHHIRIYNDVQFDKVTEFERKSNQIQYYVKLGEESYLKKINWEFSKRFIFGSLLIFTKDNFVSFFLGIVQDHNVRELQNGNLKISLASNFDGDSLLGGSYLMAESKVFFEPYYQVMKALKTMTNEVLPLQKYILGYEAAEPPKYFKTPTYYTFESKAFDVLDYDSWPKKEEFGLDVYQYKALRAALTNEFTVIQGPPGTGKTYLGILIVNMLLKNKMVWKKETKSPIIVICYTNHALDQFLEELLNIKANIVRIGGRSKNEKIAELSLNKLRFRNRNVSTVVRELVDTMNTLRTKLESLQKTVRLIRDNEGVLSIQSLYSVIPASVFENLKGEKVLQNWLFDDYIPDSEDVSSLSKYEIVFSERMDEENELRKESIIDDGILPTLPMVRIFYELSKRTLEEKIENLKLAIKDSSNFSLYELIVLKDECFGYQTMLTKLTLLLQSEVSGLNLTSRKWDKNSLWSLKESERWDLYISWKNSFMKNVDGFLINLQKKYNKLYSKLEEMNDINDVGTVLSSDVDIIGLTTTGAAKKRRFLSALKSKILIVEEAAEVLESHVIVSLTKHCEHVILIGDHKQLKPSSATYNLAKQFNLNVSLFERMLIKGMTCHSLGVQHRMKPIIASLITPVIYPNLENYCNVYQYPSIKGVTSDLFFVTHQYPENEVAEIESHVNHHEAKFIIALCKYLLLQGYMSANITILTTYSGQLLFFKSEKKKYDILQNVKVTAVDNYQGEENDIILLSLVRSNKQGKIGFLSIENRVCVALSRAKHGLFIIGDMENLMKESHLWQNINSNLQTHSAIGTALELKCEIHGTKTYVASETDFNAVQEGGCNLPCKKTLNCGHICKRLCHIIDREHVNFECRQKCERGFCDETPPHPCPRMCFELCEPCKFQVEKLLPCGHKVVQDCSSDPETMKCPVGVPFKLIDCGHDVIIPCYMPVEEFVCPKRCEDRLNCGHACYRKCHTKHDPDHIKYECRAHCARTKVGCSMNHNCDKKCYEPCEDCTVLVSKNLRCGHHSKIKCNQDVDTVKCEKKCKAIMACGHPCKKICFEPCGNCSVLVEKIVEECGHKVKIACENFPSRKYCKQLCERILPCGHKCKEKCCQDCSEKCCETVNMSPVTLACGHEATVPCFKRNDVLDLSSDIILRYCEAPCCAELPCGDICQGKCGDCMQGRIHKVCSSDCKNILVCGHVCKEPCRMNCPPCHDKCLRRCKHSRCSRPCGQPCTPCTEKCLWVCAHYSCSKKCGEMCDRPPCTNPCEILLKCGHNCIGFCGEPCPPLCRICNKDEVTEVFFGTEEEDNARFILLEDCSHTFEANGLELWIDQNQSSSAKEIKLPTCPKCTHPIETTLRFKNTIQSVYYKIHRVKKQILGKNRKGNLENIQKKFANLQMKAVPILVKEDKSYQNIIKLLRTKLNIQSKATSNRKPYYIRGVSEFRVLEFVINFLEEILKEVAELTKKTENTTFRKKAEERVSVLLYHLSSRDCKISDAEINQFKMEVLRLQRMIEYISVERVNSSFHGNKKRYEEIIKSVIYSVEPYSVFFDERVCDMVKQIVTIDIAERKMIHLAMSSSFMSSSKQGHWFTCENGHVYCITECGGAMEKSNCPDCGTEIGGENHALLRSNRLESSMDNARYAAYSDMANMNNFVLDG